jgi:hypothetical protein
MINKIYIHRSDIKNDEWYLLDPLPKHISCDLIAPFGKYFTITPKGTLNDRHVMSSDSIPIFNLPEFIEKFNEFRLFLLL